LPAVSQDTINQLPIFSLHDDTSFHFLLLRTMKPLRIHEGDVLCNQGEVGDELYLLVRGALEVIYAPEGAPEDESAEHNICEMSFGDVAGEIALFGEGTFTYEVPSKLRTVSLRAVSEMELFTIQRVYVMEICEKFPNVGKTLINLGNMRLLRTRKVGQKKVNSIGQLTIASSFINSLKKSKESKGDAASTVPSSGSDWEVVAPHSYSAQTSHADKSRDYAIEVANSRNLGLLIDRVRLDTIKQQQQSPEGSQAKRAEIARGSRPAGELAHTLKEALDAALQPLAKDVEHMKAQLSPLLSDVAHIKRQLRTERPADDGGQMQAVKAGSDTEHLRLGAPKEVLAQAVRQAMQRAMAPLEREVIALVQQRNGCDSWTV